MKNMSTTVKFVFKKNMLSNIFVFYGFVALVRKHYTMFMNSTFIKELK